MKVIIAGSRSITRMEAVSVAVAHSKFEIKCVISGHAKGVDTLGEEWAGKHNCGLLKKPADWKKHGKAAGPIRNMEMAKIADAAIIIWDGKSPGSRNMIECMQKLGKPYHVEIIDD